MFNNSISEEFEKEKLMNEKLIEENIKLNRINEKLIEENVKLNKLVKIQDKLIKSYELRKKEYQKSIINKSIKIEKLKSKLQENQKEDSQ